MYMSRVLATESTVILLSQGTRTFSDICRQDRWAVILMHIIGVIVILEQTPTMTYRDTCGQGR
jgi:hypothetical protein